MNGTIELETFVSTRHIISTDFNVIYVQTDVDFCAELIELILMSAHLMGSLFSLCAGKWRSRLDLRPMGREAPRGGGLKNASYYDSIHFYYYSYLQSLYAI